MEHKFETLEDLYVHELRDLYSAENQLIEGMSNMARAATRPDLRRAFEEDIGRTRRHMDRLQEIFKKLDREPTGHHCVGMEGVLKEGRDLLSNDAEPHVRDAGLIVAAQKAQHYEIAGYGSVCTFATMLNRQREAQMLHDTLNEEKQADSQLSNIARGPVNAQAASR